MAWGFALGCSISQDLWGPQISLPSQGGHGCRVAGGLSGVHCTDGVLAVCCLQVDEEGVL